MHSMYKRHFSLYNSCMNEKLHNYNRLLVEKNQTTNLTAHKTEEQSFKYNIQDSLLFNKTISDYLNKFKPTAKVADIGSGGGCPAIPLKISFPEINLTMLDSVRKKTDFLSEVITKLALHDTIAIHTRIEDFCLVSRESFDIVTARAVAPLNTLLEYALPLLKVGGIFFAFKGKNADEEIALSKRSLTALGGTVIETISTDLDSEITRTLIVIKKTSKTPTQYPRAKNLPRTRPL